MLFGDTLGYAGTHQLMQKIPMLTVGSGDSTVITQYISIETSEECFMAGYKIKA